MSNSEPKWANAKKYVKIVISYILPNQTIHGVSGGHYGGARTEYVHLEIDIVRRIETYDA